MAREYAPPPTSELGDDIAAALGRLRARERGGVDVVRNSGTTSGSRGLRDGSSPGNGGGQGGGSVSYPHAEFRDDDGQISMDGWWEASGVGRNASFRHNGHNGQAGPAGKRNPRLSRSRRALREIRSDPFWTVLFAMFWLIVGVMGIFVSGNAGRDAALKVINVEPAMAFHGLEIRNPKIHDGEALQISYRYDKRAECSPPDGEGEFLFKVYDGAIITRLNSGLMVDDIPSGYGLGPMITTLPPLPQLRPGKYKLGMRGVFVCMGERDAQIITPAKLAFEVIE